MAGRTTPLLRFLDRAAGIPLVAALGLLPKRRRPPDDRIRRLGILKSAAIGDTLLLAGVLEPLQARFPDARLVLITGPQNAPVVPLFSGLVAEHAVIDPRRPLPAIRALRQLDLDVLLECGPWPRVDAVIGALSGARYRVGFRVPGQARHYGFDCVVDHSASVHEIENIRSLARAMGVSEFPPPRIRHASAPADRAAPRAPYVVLHPWPGGHMSWLREWPEERWIELAGRISTELGADVLVSGGPADLARTASLVGRLRDADIRADALVGTDTLGEVAAALAASQAVVSVNTGIMHLAALVGAPTVSLNGPTSGARWGPIGPRAVSVPSRYPDCGYLHLGFEYAGRRQDCMLGIAVTDVLAAVRQVRALGA